MLRAKLLALPFLTSLFFLSLGWQTKVSDISQSSVTAIAPITKVQSTLTVQTAIQSPVAPIHSVDKLGTPIPVAQTVETPRPWDRGDGTFNYCYQLDNGTWITQVGILPIKKGIYYYGGSIDPVTKAPAYADQGQQWCADHAN